MRVCYLTKLIVYFLEVFMVRVEVIRVIRRCRNNTRIVIAGPGGIVGSVKFPSNPVIRAGAMINVPFDDLNHWPLS
jgi:hypothetical protein